jgi:hypothetical protein
LKRTTFAVDAGLAMTLAAFALIISPGVAASGIVALSVLVVCAVSFSVDRRASRSQAVSVWLRTASRGPERASSADTGRAERGRETRHRTRAERWR